MENNENPLEVIMQEIDRALDAKFYYMAISTVLTLPDVCASLESSDGKTSKSRYIRWCDRNLSAITALTPTALYSLRCGVSHNARYEQNINSHGKAVFLMPGNGNTFSNCRVNDIYFHSAVDFCKVIMNDIRIWMEVKKANEIYLCNLPKMVQYRPEGMAPVISGDTVLA